MFRIDPNKHPRVKSKLQSLLGAKVDLNTLAVFEARANDTLPITGAGGFLKDSRMTKTYLAQMQEAVNSGQYVPIIKLHNQDYSLPEGRIFDAALYDNPETEGEKDLHILFYLEGDSEYTNKVSTGIIAELSTGTSPNSICCSACGYDFLASADNRRQLYAGRGYTPLCPDGHQWGVGGNHLKLAGLSKWKETSIVTRGAVSRAKILSQTDIKLANETEQINLSQNNNNDMILTVTLQQGDVPDDLNIQLDKGTTPKENSKMTDINLKESRYQELVTAEIKLGLADQQLAAEKAIVTDLETKLREANEKLATVEETEAKLAEATQQVEALKVEKTQLETQLAAAKTGAGDKGAGLGEDNQVGDPVGLQLSNEYYTV